MGEGATKIATAALPTSIPGFRYISSSVHDSQTLYTVISIVAALTQPFWPPSSCQDLMTIYDTRDPNYSFTYGAQCSGTTIDGLVNAACHPPWVTSLSRLSTLLAGTFLQTIPMYSPATGCPAGYNVVVTVGPELRGPVSAHEEALVCCPSGFDGRDPLICTSKIRNATVSATMCADTPAFRTITIPDNFTTPEAVPLAMVWATPVVIVRSPAARDLVPAAPSADTGLSSALKAAVGISASLGVIFLGLIAYLVYRYYKRRVARRAAVVESGAAASELHANTRPTDLEADAKDAERHVYEMPDTGVDELPHDAFPPAEVGNQTEKHSGADANDAKASAGAADGAGQNKAESVSSLPASQRKFSFEAAR